MNVLSKMTRFIGTENTDEETKITILFNCLGDREINIYNTFVCEQDNYQCAIPVFKVDKSTIQTEQNK